MLILTHYLHCQLTSKYILICLISPRYHLLHPLLQRRKNRSTLKKKISKFFPLCSLSQVPPCVPASSVHARSCIQKSNSIPTVLGIEISTERNRNKTYVLQTHYWLLQSQIISMYEIIFLLPCFYCLQYLKL